MYIIREVFTAKPGMASKLAKLFTESMPNISRSNTRVLTDFIGPFNTVVMETEVENLEEFNKQYKEYLAKNPSMTEKMRGYADMYLTGSREVYQVVNVPATMSSSTSSSMSSSRSR